MFCASRARTFRGPATQEEGDSLLMGSGGFDGKQEGLAESEIAIPQRCLTPMEQDSKLH